MDIKNQLGDKNENKGKESSIHFQKIKSKSKVL